MDLRKGLVFVHRWMGVGFCLLFLLWFSSGVVLMYCDYPSISDADRIAREPALDASRIQLSPSAAFERLHTPIQPDRTLLLTFNGRPAYEFGGGDSESIVYADNGEVQGDFSPAICLQIASAWTKQPPASAIVEAQTQQDQWTVSGAFNSLRPLLKYSWPNGEQVYVSEVNGHVVQYTTRATRAGAYFGAIPHWLYFTPLRRHNAAWTKVVIWASGLGSVSALFGIVLAVWVYSPAKRYRRAGLSSSIPYTGQKRWHMILGLAFGILACTWSFSGMLSMDPFPQWQGTAGQPASAETLESALEGDPVEMAAFDAKSPQEALALVQPKIEPVDFKTPDSKTPEPKVKELELTSFAGTPFYLAILAPGQTRVIPVVGEPQAEIDDGQIVAVLRAAASPATVEEVKFLTRYDSYYLDRHNRLPLPVIFLRLGDREHSTLYVDPKTARIVRSYGSRSRWNRWLYHGLHSMDLPWLYSHRPAWDIVVLALLAGGAALCITSLILAWRVLCRKLGVTEDRPSRMERMV